MKSQSFFVQHPWMTFFLGLAVVNGIVIAVRGYGPPAQPLFRPRPAGTFPQPFPSPSVRGTYR